VGDEAIREIIREREANGPYTDLADFCSRVNLRKVTKRVVEYLIKSGSMDCLEMSRAGLMAGLDKAVAYGQKKAKEKASGQISMLDMLGGVGDDPAPAVDLLREERSLPEWPDDEKLKLEKEALGFFLSSHPLLAYRREMGRMQLTPLDECKEYDKGAQVKAGLIVTAVKEHVTKRGEKMAFCQVEDLSGPGEMTMFADVYQKAKELIAQDAPLLVAAKVDVREKDNGDDGPKSAKLLAEEVSLLAEAQLAADAPVVLDLDLAEGDGLQERLAALKDLLARHPGKAPASLRVSLPGCICTLHLEDSYKIWPSSDFWREFEAWRALAAPTSGEGGQAA
jgi:DNA polymerase-3 subunit alpha